MVTSLTTQLPEADKSILFKQQQNTHVPEIYKDELISFFVRQKCINSRKFLNFFPVQVNIWARETSPWNAGLVSVIKKKIVLVILSLSISLKVILIA